MPLFEVFIYDVTLDNAESLWSNLTCSSFSLLLLVMLRFPIFILTVLFVLTKKQHLAALISLHFH